MAASHARKAAATTTAKNDGATVDIASLAAGAQVAPALPKVSRTSAVSPFEALVQKSYEEQNAMSLPAVPSEQVRSVHSTIRRAATRLGLGVSIRDQHTSDGVVVTFQAKTRQTRKS